MGGHISNWRKTKRLKLDGPDIKSGRSLESKLNDLFESVSAIKIGPSFQMKMDGHLGESDPYFVKIGH